MIEVTNSFCDEIQRTDWHVLSHDNIDTCTENVTTCIKELAKKHILNKNNNLQAIGSILADYAYKKKKMTSINSKTLKMIMVPTITNFWKHDRQRNI